MFLTLDLYWGSLEVSQTTGPDHLYYAQTKKVTDHSKNPYFQHCVLESLNSLAIITFSTLYNLALGRIILQHML